MSPLRQAQAQAPRGPVRVRQRGDPGAVVAPSQLCPATPADHAEARVRLQGLGTALLLVWLFALVEHRQLVALWGGRFPPGTPEVGVSLPQLVLYDSLLALFGAATSAALVAYARWAPASLTRLGHVGLAFGLVTGATLSMAEAVLGLAPGLHPGIPAVSAWVVLFPIIVPAPAGRAALTAVATALTTPLAMLIWDRLGTPLPDLARLVAWLSPTLTVASITYLPLRMLARVRERAAAAESLVDKLGSYELVEPLGSGGMGEVWRARHVRLARPAAIKLIRPSRLQAEVESHSSVAARFVREAEATAALQSPHTVSVYDFGVTEGGDLYLVMELLDGEDLSSLVKRTGPLPPARVAHLMRQACRSLGEAHARGLVHRDVKPANLVVCTFALEDDFLKLLDFGLVMHRTARDGDVELTAAGSITGTPAFMAPELATGDAEVDGRADLYGLGCVAWYLLTGAFVFEVRSPVQALLAHVQQEPDPGRLHAAQPVPEHLERLILRCLAKSPADRPATARAMELELEAMADTLGPAWTPARATAWWQTHARSAVGAAVAFDQADTARDASDTSHPSSPEDPRAPTDAGDAGGLASTVPS